MRLAVRDEPGHGLDLFPSKSPERTRRTRRALRARGGVVFRVGLRGGYGVRRPPEGPAPEEGHPRTGLRGLTPPERRPPAFAAERAHEGPLVSPKGRGGGDERRTCLSSDPPGRAGLSQSVLWRGSQCCLAQRAARGPESEAAARGGWLGSHEERPGKPEFPSAVTGVAAARTHTVRDPNPSRGSPVTRRSGNRDSVRPVLPGYGRPQSRRANWVVARPPPDSRPPAEAGLLDATTTYRR